MRPQETIEQFIARGGKIKKIDARPYVESHRTRFRFKDLPDKNYTLRPSGNSRTNKAAISRP